MADALNPEQLCFALHKDGGLMTRDGRLVWAERKVWDGLPAAVQIIPIKGAPPLGSVPLDTSHAGPDIADLLNAVVEKMDANRVHERELLRRAAALIDQDNDPLGSYEERLDWLAKYREVIS